MKSRLHRDLGGKRRPPGRALRMVTVGLDNIKELNWNL